MKFKVKVIFVRPFNWPFLKFMCICIHFNRHLKALTCSSCTVYSLQNTISGQLINAAKSQYKETIIHAAQYACVRLPWGGEHLTWGLYEARGITWSGPAKAFGVGELMKCLARDSRLIFKLVSIAFVCNVNSRIITTCEGSYWGIALTLLFFFCVSDNHMSKPDSAFAAAGSVTHWSNVLLPLWFWRLSNTFRNQSSNHHQFWYVHRTLVFGFKSTIKNI